MGDRSPPLTECHCSYLAQEEVDEVLVGLGGCVLQVI